MLRFLSSLKKLLNMHFAKIVLATLIVPIVLTGCFDNGKADEAEYKKKVQERKAALKKQNDAFKWEVDPKSQEAWDDLTGKK